MSNQTKPVFTYAEMHTALGKIVATDNVLVGIGSSSSTLRRFKVDKRSATKLYCTSPRGISVTMTMVEHARTVWIHYPNESKAGGTRSRRVSALAVEKISVAPKAPTGWTPELRRIAQLLEPILVEGSTLIGDPIAWIERAIQGLHSQMDALARVEGELQLARDKIAHLESKLDSATKDASAVRETLGSVRTASLDLEARMVTLLQAARHDKIEPGRSLASHYKLSAAEAALEILAAMHTRSA